jgi:hypothetical protein
MDNIITTSKAIEIARQHGRIVTRAGVIYWCNKYSMGKKIFGRWHINKKILIEYLEGNK